MKHPKLNIRIPEPCHEDWHKMSPTEKGKFCHVCTKEVIDFTAKNDEEIINYFQNHGNLCGRFLSSQLNRTLIVDRKQRNHWLSYAASLLLPLTLFSQEKTVTEKQIPKTVHTETSKFTSLQIGAFANKKATNKITISGVVTDSMGTKIHNADVSVKNTNTGVVTDIDGFFMLKVRVGDTLKISHGFYNTKYVPVHANSRTYNTVLEINSPKEESMVLGGAVLGYELESHIKSEIAAEIIKARDQRTENYFAFQRKKWLEKREKRREKRAARRAKRKEKRN